MLYNFNERQGNRQRAFVAQSAAAASICRSGSRGSGCAVIRRWICPHWDKYFITDLAKPQLRSAMDAWLADLCESGKLAPKTVRGVGSLMRLIFRRAVKWGYLQNNPMDYVDLPED